jgi:hypothetical protein
MTGAEPVRALGVSGTKRIPEPDCGNRGPGMGCRTKHVFSAGLLTAGLLSCGGIAHAQSLEPRAYSPAPTGLNFVIAGFAFTKGGLSFDTAVPVTDAHLSTSGPILAYARTLDIAGRSGKVDVILPFARLSGSALFQGQPVSRDVTGAADPLLRLSVILHGAPAMTPAEFRTYRQGLLVGASVQVSAPLGQYDGTRLLNIGTNRWSVKPAIGVSQAFGRWTVELEGAATLFTTNNDFFGGGTRAQRPLLSGQLHVVRGFRPGVWASFDATFFTGGRTTINNSISNDLQRNWRAGATLAVPIGQRFSVKFYASTGVSARTGNNFDLVGAAVQYRWRAGF